jgi:hypothetical protein
VSSPRLDPCPLARMLGICSWSSESSYSPERKGSPPLPGCAAAVEGEGGTTNELPSRAAGILAETGAANPESSSPYPSYFVSSCGDGRCRRALEMVRGLRCTDGSSVVAIVVLGPTARTALTVRRMAALLIVLRGELEAMMAATSARSRSLSSNSCPVLWYAVLIKGMPVTRLALCSGEFSKSRVMRDARTKSSKGAVAFAVGPAGSSRIFVRPPAWNALLSISINLLIRADVFCVSIGRSYGAAACNVCLSVLM